MRTRQSCESQMVRTRVIVRLGELNWPKAGWLRTLARVAIYRAWILKLTSPPSTAIVLIAIIAQLQATVLEQQRAVLPNWKARRNRAARPDARPPKSGRKPPAQQQPRKQRRHGFARRRMTPKSWWRAVPIDSPDSGSSAGSHVAGGSGASHRDHQDLPSVSTAHRATGRRGTGAPLGVNVLSRIATLREECRSAAYSGVWIPYISCASWGPL